jgi:lipoprotein-anchoring transpeptidase ErfK/SrfK
VSRLLRAVAVFVGVVPAVAVLVAVNATPRSAYSVPSLEVRTPSGAVRLSADDLGAYRTSHGVAIDPSAMDQTLDRLAALFGVPARPDAYALANGRVILTPGHAGVALDRSATRSLLMRLVHGDGGDAALPVRSVAPPAAPAHAIVVELSRFGLDLYARTALVEHFTVGVGRLSFPTPPGAYYVKWKEKNPAWRNPGSSWAHDMPWYMPPGPDNPLGTRALELDRGALVIHGTPEPWTIGSRSSHGCIRMRRADVEKLFDEVPVGTPVFIVP